MAGDRMVLALLMIPVSAGILLLFLLVMDLIIRYWKFEWETRSDKIKIQSNRVAKIWRSRFGWLLFISVLLIFLPPLGYVGYKELKNYGNRSNPDQEETVTLSEPVEEELVPKLETLNTERHWKN